MNKGSKGPLLHPGGLTVSEASSGFRNVLGGPEGTFGENLRHVGCRNLAALKIGTAQRRPQTVANAAVKTLILCFPKSKQLGVLDPRQ